MYNEVITLLTITEETEGMDTIESVPKETVLFAKVLSVGMKEVYEAKSVGLKPELVFEIADYLDYEGQEAISYNEERYTVLRTYRKKDGNELEITVTR